MKLGAPSFIVGALGIVAPFFIGCFVFVAMDVASLPAIIIVVTALTATIIAISVQLLNDLGRLHSKRRQAHFGRDSSR